MTHSHMSLFRSLLSACLFLFVASSHSQIIHETDILAPNKNVATTGLGAYDIAMNEGVIAMTAWSASGNAVGEQDGAVFLFDRMTHKQIGLIRSNYRSDGFFPYAMDVDEDVLVATDRSDTQLQGVIHVFDINSRVLLRTITTSTNNFGNAFGTSVAVANGKVAVSASNEDNQGIPDGAVYVFDIHTGEQLYRLVPVGAVSPAGIQFGSELYMDNEYIYVGAPNNNDREPNSGAVYLYDAVTGEYVHTFYPNDPQTGAEFGKQISVSNHVLAVGASRADWTSSSSGAVYLFDIKSGVQFRKLTPCGDIKFFQFGNSLSIDQDTLVIGAAGDYRETPNIGSYFVYNLSTSSLIANYFHTAFNGPTWIDSTVALNGDDLIYRIRGNEVPGESIAAISKVPCAPDLEPDGHINFLDIQVFLSEMPDLTCDGRFNFFDISVFLRNFQSCP